MRIVIENKQDCCGCELCSQICPVSIIKMKPDGEGFLYPEVEEPDKCINCGKCVRLCPEKTRTISPRKLVEVYTGHASNEELISQCASGGLATSISVAFIRRGGVVYGVKYTNNCKDIVYDRATAVEELNPFKGSKYAQVRKLDIFKIILCDLKEGRDVLFVGLPCDTAALYNYTKNKYDNLYTVGLICHGVTSPKVHEQFIVNDCNKRNAAITDFSVRYKKNAWKPYYIYESFSNGERSIRPFRPTTYGIAFHYFKRPICNVCRFKIFDKEFGLQSDLTIGDNHGVSLESISYNKWGSSVALVHTEKGRQLIDIIRNEFVLEKGSDVVVNQNLALYAAFPVKPNRDKFSTAFYTKGLKSACTIPSVLYQEFKISFQDKTITTIKLLFKIVGLSNFQHRCAVFVKKMLRQ